MQESRGFLNALLAALISIGLILGALSISLVEFAPQAASTATDFLLPSPAPLTATPTAIPTLTSNIQPAPSLTPTSTDTPVPPASCQPPSGWTQIVIQAGETLDTIASRYRISADELRRANCLLSDNLVTGTILYAPPGIISTSVMCVQGAVGWVKSYNVKPGDTLYSIATNHYTTANLLKSVNCRVSDLILPGDILWVPNVSTRTPQPTPLPGNTVTPQPTLPLTETALPFTVTPSPTSTPVPDTPTPTNTPAPTPTSTPAAFPT
ncbi:MAG: LysM peptidoglycan-binding domain-containing protein [Chloroflexi bacterium]|nr:LysM peptidoglycan-binding domain-containing protein [Chloroflexota bacterium]